MFGFESKGSFKNTEEFLKKSLDMTIYERLSRYGAEGVRALSSATPQDEGLTAASWSYEILKEANTWSIVWNNTNDANGTPVAVLIQLGHATGTGGYVPPRDFINPALKPIFDRMTKEVWKEMTS